MDIFKEWNNRIPPLDADAMAAAVSRWNSIAKPLGSLGVLEADIIKLAGIQRTADISVSKRAVIVMCADNGVVAQGVTQTGQEVTAIVAENMARGDSSVCRMAKIAHADVIPVDIGMVTEAAPRGVIDRKITRGTRDMTAVPAMTPAEAIKALSVGVEMAEYSAEHGYDIIATGEMGIGNTTTSSAITAVFTGAPVELVTGKGAGLSDEGLLRKCSAIKTAIAVNRPNPSDALDTLSKVGGLDIAGLAGLIIGASMNKLPIMLDGFISLAAALTAVRLCPNCADYLIASHVSKEPASKLLFSELDLSPIIDAGMRLGEGTGAVAALPLIDMANAVYSEMKTFDDISVEAYKPL